MLKVLDNSYSIRLSTKPVDNFVDKLRPIKPRKHYNGFAIKLFSYCTDIFINLFNRLHNINGLYQCLVRMCKVSEILTDSL